MPGGEINLSRKMSYLTLRFRELNPGWVGLIVLRCDLTAFHGRKMPPTSCLGREGKRRNKSVHIPFKGMSYVSRRLTIRRPTLRP